MKKRWFVIPATVGLLAVFAAGGSIFAHGNAHLGGGAPQEFISKLAVNLGMDEATVQTAFNKTAREQQDAKLQEKLDRAVENERLTQEEADAIHNWFTSRPDAALYLRGVMFRSEEAVQRLLDRMVENEKLTQDEADQVMSWYQDRPEDLPVREGRRGHRGQRSGDGGPRGAYGNSTGFFGAPNGDYTRSYSTPGVLQ